MVTSLTANPIPPSPMLSAPLFGHPCTMVQAELVEESKAEAVAQALKAAGKTTIPVPRGNADKGNTDQGVAKAEREQKLHRLTRKKRRRILAREADERQAKEEVEELKAQGGLFLGGCVGVATFVLECGDWLHGGMDACARLGVRLCSPKLLSFFSPRVCGVSVQASPCPRTSRRNRSCGQLRRRPGRRRERRKTSRSQRSVETASFSRFSLIQACCRCCFWPIGGAPNLTAIACLSSSLGAWKWKWSV